MRPDLICRLLVWGICAPLVFLAWIVWHSLVIAISLFIMVPRWTLTGEWDSEISREMFWSPIPWKLRDEIVESLEHSKTTFTDLDRSTTD